MMEGLKSAPSNVILDKVYKSPSIGLFSRALIPNTENSTEETFTALFLISYLTKLLSDRGGLRFEL